MKSNGFLPSPQNYIVLLRCCAKWGDFARFKIYWNQLLIKSLEKVEMFKDFEFTGIHFGLLFQCISKTIRLKKHSNPLVNIPKEELLDVEKDVLSHTLYLFDNNHSISKFQNIAKENWSYITSSLDSSNVTTHLLNSYLSVFSVAEIFDQSLIIYNSFYSKYNVEKDGVTFQLMMELVLRSPLKSKASQALDSIYSDFFKWDTEMEKKIVRGHSSEKHDSQKITSMSLVEKEKNRNGQFRDASSLRKTFILMINGYTKNKNYEKALETLEKSKVFREPMYIQQIHFTDIWSFFKAANSLAEDGDIEVAKKLVELCPPPEKSQVSELLKGKFSSRTWWGWDALGYSSKRREKMMRSQRKLKR